MLLRKHLTEDFILHAGKGQNWSHQESEMHKNKIMT
jgi:hypothetical protein